MYANVTEVVPKSIAAMLSLVVQYPVTKRFILLALERGSFGGGGALTPIILIICTCYHTAINMLKYLYQWVITATEWECSEKTLDVNQNALPNHKHQNVFFIAQRKR